MDIKEWLESTGLVEYIDVFTDNGIDFEDLPDLSAEELRDDLGITRPGHRKKLLKAIEALISAHLDLPFQRYF